ncbi:MAG: cysteine desulfurase family protein [Bauldia sp.]
MADKRIFLDWNAGAPLRPQARAAMLEALDLAGNPSSVHREGREARRLVDEARAKIAALFAVEPAGVVFTSGATEAANLALYSEAAHPSGHADAGRLIVCATEHVSVLQGHKFPPERVGTAAVDADGVVKVAELAARVAAATAEGGQASVIVAVQAANNETGVIQPIADIAAAIEPSGAVLVVDAAQAAGKTPLDAVPKHAGMTILSAHKLGGPKGVGALIVRNGAVQVAPLIRGGGQEFRRRAGTENLLGIVGFAAAAEVAVAEAAAFAAGATRLRDNLEAALLAATPEAVIYGRAVPRLANTTLIGVPGLSGETLVMAFDLAGAAVSSGAACSSGKVGPSHVLAAMGAEKTATRSAVRISFGWETSAEDLHRFSQLWRQVVSQIRKNGAVQAA